MAPQGNLIQASDKGAIELADTVKASLSGYLDFTLSTIGPSSGVEGGYKHDGLSRGIKGALSAWNDLILSDANALIAAHGALTDVDKAQAQQMLGVGCAS